MSSPSHREYWVLRVLFVLRVLVLGSKERVWHTYELILIWTTNLRFGGGETGNCLWVFIFIATVGGEKNWVISICGALDLMGMFTLPLVLYHLDLDFGSYIYIRQFFLIVRFGLLNRGFSVKCHQTKPNRAWFQTSKNFVLVHPQPW